MDGLTYTLLCLIENSSAEVSLLAKETGEPFCDDMLSRAALELMAGSKRFVIDRPLVGTWLALLANLLDEARSTRSQWRLLDISAVYALQLDCFRRLFLTPISPGY